MSSPTAQRLVVELYLEGGIRGVEIGSVMFGRRDQNGNESASDKELVRLALPRRVYTQAHVNYLIERISAVFSKREHAKGLRIIKQSPILRHFTAHFEPH